MRREETRRELFSWRTTLNHLKVYEARSAGHINMSGEEMSEGNMFSITRASTGNAARTGLLNLPNRQPIKTPHYLALASRGAIPHLTQDNVAKHTDIRGAYMAVEDCTLYPSKSIAEQRS